jgi:hypothetical protein
MPARTQPAVPSGRSVRLSPQVLGSYGYSEIRLPIVEQTPLFKRAIGEVTDVVEKEKCAARERFRPADNRSCHGWLECSLPRLFSLYIQTTA